MKVLSVAAQIKGFFQDCPSSGASLCESLAAMHKLSLGLSGFGQDQSLQRPHELMDAFVWVGLRQSVHQNLEPSDHAFELRPERFHIGDNLPKTGSLLQTA